jgi:hypothetical protein
MNASLTFSLPPFDIASAPLTYVAVHTARLATKVE